MLRCLWSIRESRTSLPVKVIVVDNNSADGSRERAAAEFPEFQVLNTGANLGFGRANNYARSMADTPLVLFLNPDTELLPDTLERAVHSLLARPQVGLLGCQMRYPDGTVQELGLQWFPTPGRIFFELVVPGLLRKGPWGRRLRHDPRQSGPVKKLYGGFFLFRKEVLDAAGWYDERYFMYAEDVDLSRTVQDLGWEIHYDAAYYALHAGGACSAKARAGFSVLMQLSANQQMIEKYQGVFAAIRFRWAVGFAAVLRIAGLWIIRPFLGTKAQANRFASAWIRTLWLFRWSWRGVRASIPSTPCAIETARGHNCHARLQTP